MRVVGVVAVCAALVACTKKNIRECEGNLDCHAESGGVCRTYVETGHQWCSYPDSECPSGYHWGGVTVGDDLADTCVVEDSPPIPDAVPCDERVSWGKSDDVWIGNVDGTEQQNLTQTDGISEINPVWSRDGRAFAYARFNDDTYEIWTTKLDGSDSQPLTEGNDTVPQWAPDGERIVFLRNNEGLQLWSVRADGGGVPIELSTGTETEFGPAFSPDGEQIAFVSSSAGTANIWLMDADGSNQSQLTHVDHLFGGSFEKIAAWSPDGSRLLVAAAQPSNIWVIDADGQNAENLTHELGDVSGPDWMADGRIVFEHDGDQWVMNADGTGQSMLIDDAKQASLSADRTRLVFLRGDSISNVWVANIDGSGETRITTTGASAEYPRWVGCPE